MTNGTIGTTLTVLIFIVVGISLTYTIQFAIELIRPTDKQTKQTKHLKNVLALKEFHRDLLNAIITGDFETMEIEVGREGVNLFFYYGTGRGEDDTRPARRLNVEKHLAQLEQRRFLQHDSYGREFDLSDNEPWHTAFTDNSAHALQIVHYVYDCCEIPVDMEEQ